MKKEFYIKLYPIRRLNTELEEIFDGTIAVYDEWNDGFVDSYIDERVYYWYDKSEFEKLKEGDMMDESIIFLTELDKHTYTVETLTLEVD